MERQDKQQRAAALKIPAAESAGSLCAGALQYAPQPGAVFRPCVGILTECIKNACTETACSACVWRARYFNFEDYKLMRV